MPTARRRTSSYFDPPPEAPPRACDHPGCDRPGDYKAPRARDRLRDYYWFCLDHVRAYNKAWNYCQDMDETELERMLREDTVWQRPTWPMGAAGAREEAIRARVYRDFGLGAEPGTEGRRRATEEGESDRARPGRDADRALAVLDLDYPVDFDTIKARYKALVKRHHPDANGGSREAEERLKIINRAYSILKAAFAPSLRA